MYFLKLYLFFKIIIILQFICIVLYLSFVQSNPLYEENGMNIVNPLYEADPIEAAA